MHSKNTKNASKKYMITTEMKSDAIKNTGSDEKVGDYMRTMERII